MALRLLGIIGANRSPNCGVDTTSDFNIEIEGMGLFMNKLCSELEEQNIKIPFLGLNPQMISMQNLAAF